jgi:hypothetical protein
MDWTYKHFNQEATFNMPYRSVLEAARAVVAESAGEIEDATDGFVARGRSAWHNTIATFRITPVPNGTQVAVELLVKRASIWGYMLFDPGDYYNGRIDKWFSAIAARLGSAQEQVLVSTTTSNLKVRRGCLTGCLVYLVAGACLAIFAIPLDRALFPNASESVPGPFSLAASGIGFLAGVAVFLYIGYPDSSPSKFIRARLHSAPGKERQP